MPLHRVWLYIEASIENDQNEWERTRILAYMMGKFGGNSDPKKFPKTPQKFWPFPWEAQTSGRKSKEQILAEHNEKKRQRAMVSQRIELLDQPK